MTETAVGKPGRRARAPRAPEPQRASVVAFGLVAILVIATGAALGPPAGVAAVAAVGFGIIVLRRPVVGAYVLAACVAPMSGLHRGLPVPGFRLTELLIVGVATIVLVTARTTPRWSTFDWLAFGYVIANGMLVWVNVVRTEGSFSGDTFGTLIGPLQYFLLYRTLMTAITTREERARALSLVLLSSIPVAILTLFQQWNIAGARSLLDTLTGPEGASAYANTLTDVARATGPFPHWHNLAGYLMLVLLLIVSLLHERTQLVMRNRNLALIFIPAVVALAQTASIAPMLGLIVGSILVATYVGQTRRLLMWLGIGSIVGTVAFWSVFAGRIQEQYRATGTTDSHTFLPQTIAFRWEVWTTQFIPIIRENLIIGYGPNLPPRLFFGYQESLYITFLLRGGIILLFFYLALMASFAIRARRIARSPDPEKSSVARAVFAAVVLLLVIDTIATYFVDSGPAPMLWTLAGLMGADVARQRPNALRRLELRPRRGRVTANGAGAR